MERMWNFKNDISIKLEYYGRRTLGKQAPSSDEIDTGKFVETMRAILYALHYTPSEIKEFLGQCKPYENLSYTRINKDDAQEIFVEFENLYNAKI